MNKNYFFVFIVGAIVIMGGAYAILTRVSPTDTPQQTTSLQPPKESTDAPHTSATILYTSSGFFPQTVTVKKGTTVNWINESAMDMWPASAMHPNHTVYPGSGITKCGTAEESHIFDACRGVAPGNAWSFTFNEVGRWNYHDHLTPRFFGTIIVEE